MTEQELQPLLIQESNSVDWKATGDPENIVETFVAFANDYEEAGGGCIRCGIEEFEDDKGATKARVAGISSQDAKRLSDRIFELSRRLSTPSIEPHFESCSLGEDKQILIVRIAASGDVHTSTSKRH